MRDPDVPVGIGVPTLQVIGPGFGRTGTLSMRMALERLGFAPCDHMVQNEQNPARFALWDEALRRKLAGDPIDWRPLLTGFRAIVDWPGAYFWRELVAAHPAAKVVLTSAQWPADGTAALDIIATRTFGNRLDDRAHCQAVLARHIQAIRETIDPARLLVFDVKQGWEPLGAFLDVPVPEGEPFPHVNDTDAFWTDYEEALR